MLKINNINFNKVMIPLLLAYAGLGGVFLYQHLTYVPEYTSALYNDDGTSVSTPLYKSLSNITYMQEMTANVCKSCLVSPTVA